MKSPHIKAVSNYSHILCWLLSLLFLLSASAEVRNTANVYKPALPGYHYQFPADHAAHPGFKTEWWYYTGHLKSTNPGENTPNKQFGYELTFFRSGVETPKAKQQIAYTSPWQVQDIFPAHFAITEEITPGGRFQFSEKLNRGNKQSTLKLAGAKNDIYFVWNEDWSAETLGPYHLLRAESPAFRLRLLLLPEKAPVIHGQNGVSQKSGCTGCASHYYSLTRIKTWGTLYAKHPNHQETAYPVQGLSWMDHEFGSNQLSANQVGWDWFSIQLNNGTELMLYLLRTKDGTLDPHSAGTWIPKEAKNQHLKLNQFRVTADRIWLSPTTKGRYPSHWKIEVPSLKLSLDITPTVANQELVTSGSTGLAYWEGSSRVTGKQNGNPVSGQAYVELTGYAKAFQARI